MEPKSADLAFVLEIHPDREHALTQRLVDHNALSSPLWYENHDERFSVQPLQVFALVGEDAVAGLMGRTHAIRTWLEIGVLWVDEERRGMGIGRALMDRAEAEARRRGCLYARLATSLNQAPGFYERLGYERYGRLDDCPPGDVALFYRKTLAKPG